MVCSCLVWKKSDQEMSAMKDLVFKYIILSKLSKLFKNLTRGNLRILCFHGLWVTDGFQFGDRLFITPEQFHKRMKYIKDNYEVIALSDGVRRLKEGRIDGHPVVVTIDDGWSSSYTHMLPILEEFDIPATIYVATNYVDRKLPVVWKTIEYLCARSGKPMDKDVVLAINEMESDEQKVSKITSISHDFGIPLDWWEARQFHYMTNEELLDAHGRGLDIQLHTHNHNVINMEFEIQRNREILSEILPDGISFDHFCYPSGEYNSEVIKALSRHGIQSATVVDQGINASSADPLLLRRFLDGKSVSDLEFRSYLEGTLHFTDRINQMVRAFRRGVTPRLAR